MDFNWQRQPEAEKIILASLELALQKNKALSKLSQDLLQQTSTRLFDWVDYLSLKESDGLCEHLEKAGFVVQENDQERVYHHPGAQLPRLVLHHQNEMEIGVAIAVEAIADFLMVRGEQRQIEGQPFGDFRRALFSYENGVAVWVVERRGTLSFKPSEVTSQIQFQALEALMTRPRPLENEAQAMQSTLQLAVDWVKKIGPHSMAWTILEVERRYWQARNTAGQIQKNRQDRLGMGWANHDHHTFRSSRRHFAELVQLFEMTGFHCRERFYAGEEAGWGAQVMENPVCRLVLFLDVDLAPGEIDQDFAHEPLPELKNLGTVGLWCALHGDSILRGGMHHLEAQFMFDELAQDLSRHGIGMMNPFSSFPHLKQAFTIGENWSVDPQRVRQLVDQGKITPEEGERFMAQGAIGSHLENLQRREGFKGFNQKNVSTIIKKTDPRLQP